MRLKCFILVMMCCCLVLDASAQLVFTIRGVIAKKLSTERVSQVVITNMRSKDIMMSDELGWFTVKAAIGDTLLFSKPEYTDQEIVVMSSHDIPVYIQPVIKLAEVKIQGQTKKQELQDVMHDYGRKGIYYNGDPPLASLILNPLNDLHLLFGTDAKNLRRFKAYSKGELEYAEVHKRYTLALVKRVTHTSDSTAKKFMDYYTPSFEDLKEWNDYELIKHIHESYVFYDKSADKERLRSGPQALDPEKKEKL